MTYPKIDKPTVPGWYWAKSPRPFQRWDVVEVIESVDGGLVVCESMKDTFTEVDFFVSWFGPLPEPTE
jgi:hypothetical protein